MFQGCDNYVIGRVICSFSKDHGAYIRKDQAPPRKNAGNHSPNNTASHLRRPESNSNTVVRTPNLAYWALLSTLTFSNQIHLTAVFNSTYNAKICIYHLEYSNFMVGILNLSY